VGAVDGWAVAALDGVVRGRHVRAVVALTAANSLVVLGVTVLSIAGPVLQRDLRLSELGSLAGFYSLLVGALPPVARRLGEVFGWRRLFLAGMVVFGAASLAAGLAPSAWWFLLARAVQGAGGGLALAGATDLIVEYPGRERRGLGVYFAATGVAGTLGVLVGGLLVEFLSWR